MTSSTIKAFLLGALAVAAGAPAARAAPMVTLDLCEMKPVFMEEFDTESIASRVIGPARWIAHTPWNGDFGDAAFADPGPGGPFSVQGGMLRITASKTPDGHWRSGLIAAADAAGHGPGVQYGYFEARMKLPPGPGTWPAFWLGSQQVANAPGPSIELDVIEYYGHATASYNAAVHVWYQPPGTSTQDVHTVAVPDRSLVEQFHRYGVRVSPQTLTFYFDGLPMWQVATPPELRKPLYPLVNLALGSGFPVDKTPNPSVLLVDYVHVYSLDPGGRGARCPNGAVAP
jgi:hypothetical protein